MSTKKLTPAMLRELHNMNTLSGEPTDPFDWAHAPAGLWFWARDKVIGALLRRKLIEDDGHGGYLITEAGRAVIDSAKVEA